MVILLFVVVVHGTGLRIGRCEYLDICGNCIGDVPTRECGDCFGVPYGPARWDECGVCGGGGAPLCRGKCFLDGCKNETIRPPLLLTERVLFGDICAEHDSYVAYLRADTRVFSVNKTNTQTYTLESRPPIVREAINFQPTCANKCDSNFTGCQELLEVKQITPYPECVYNQTRNVTIYDDQTGWQMYGLLTAETPECMTAIVNGVNFGNFRMINVHAKMFDGHFPGVGVLYANGFIRLVPFGADDDECQSPSTCFGSSFVLGPMAVLPQPRNFMTMPDLHPYIETIEFNISPGPNPFSYVAVGYYAHRTLGKLFDIVWTVEVPYPTQSLFRVNVQQEATPINNGFQNIYAFSVVGISSMYANEYVHDASSTHIKHHPYDYQTMRAERLRHQDLDTPFSFEAIDKLDISLVTDIPTSHNLGAPDCSIYNLVIEGLNTVAELYGV